MMLTENKMKIDVIIPVYRPGSRFLEMVRRLTIQTRPVNRFIIMNTEEDLWNDWVEDLPIGSLPSNLSVFHVTKEEFDHGATRHLGILQSDADICVFMTHDAMPANKKLIERLTDGLMEEESIGAAYARQMAEQDCHVIERYTRSFNYPEESSIKSKDDLEQLGIKTFFCSDVCAVYRKSVYDELGGFVTQTIFNEDMILASKIIDAGYSIAYAADAKVYHAHKYTYRQQFTRNFDLGVSQRQYRQVFEGVKSESEGIKMVKQTAGYLLKEGHPFLIIDLVLQSGFKFLGYRLGKRYDKLPLWLIRACSMQKSYWENGKG